MVEIRPVLPLPVILLVDDHKETLDLLEVHFMDAGCKVIKASTFDKAKKAVRENESYIVAIIDVNLGGERSGLDFIEEVKKVAPHRVFPIVLTGDTSDEMEKKILAAGGYHIFYKATSPERSLVNHALYSPVRTLVGDLMTDRLTGLSTFEPFNQRAIELLKAVASRKKVISLMFFDVDDFGELNDQYGHLVGDEVLRTLGKILKNHEHFRPDDPVCRRSGKEGASDECMALVMGANEAVAMQIADRIRKDIEAADVRSGGIPISFSVSIGVAQITQEEIRAELSRWPKDQKEEGFKSVWKSLQDQAEIYSSHSLVQAKALKDELKKAKLKDELKVA